MKALTGKKTYIIAFAAVLFQVAYAQALIPVDTEAHAMILGMFGFGIVVTLRQGVSKPGPEAAKPKGGP